MNRMNKEFQSALKLEKEIASASLLIERQHRSIVCKHCGDQPVTHLLVKGIGKFPNYTDTLICTEYSK